MLCPECRVEMIVVEFEQVEVDFCPACRGVWLDSGELELLGERAGVLHEDLLAAVETAPGGTAPSDQKKRPCPVCRRSMLSVNVGPGPLLTLDRCPRQHGLWFDRGELSTVVQAAGADPRNVLARFFQDMEQGKKSP